MKCEIGQIYEWKERPGEFWRIEEYISRDRNKDNCKIRKIISNIEYNYTINYKTEVLNNKEIWKYVGNNLKMARILYGT